MFLQGLLQRRLEEECCSCMLQDTAVWLVQEALATCRLYSGIAAEQSQVNHLLCWIYSYGIPIK